MLRIWPLLRVNLWLCYAESSVRLLQVTQSMDQRHIVEQLLDGQSIFIFSLAQPFFYNGGGTFAWLRIEKMCKGRGGAVHCLKYSLKFQRLNILITKMYTHIWHFTYPFSLYAIPCVGTQVVCSKKRRTCFDHLGVINLCVILGHHYVNVSKSSTFFHSFLHFYLKSYKYL